MRAYFPHLGTPMPDYPNYSCALLSVNHLIVCALGGHLDKIPLYSHSYNLAQKRNPNFYAGGYDH
jgi:hypothetical protein